MLIIEAGPMVIHQKLNRCMQEQSLAEVQKTIAIYEFALVSNFRAGDGKKVWCLVVFAGPPCNKE